VASAQAALAAAIGSTSTKSATSPAKTVNSKFLSKVK
jgi:hypothetical protein